MFTTVADFWLSFTTKNYIIIYTADSCVLCRPIVFMCRIVVVLRQNIICRNNDLCCSDIKYIRPIRSDCVYIINYLIIYLNSTLPIIDSMSSSSYYPASLMILQFVSLKSVSSLLYILTRTFCEWF